MKHVFLFQTITTVATYDVEILNKSDKILKETAIPSLIDETI
jgi:hypothetical protein